MLISISTLALDVRLGLWRIEERLQDIDSEHFPAMAEAKSESRKLEIMAVYSLLQEMTGCKGLRIAYDKNGKPLLEGWHLSISHTRGYAALILSKSREVAVDIEYQSQRVDKIVSHFIRPDEPVETTREHLICWCAKETAYKYYSEADLKYFDMRMSAVPAGSEGTIKMECLPIGKTLHVHFEVNADYTLTYSF